MNLKLNALLIARLYELAMVVANGSIVSVGEDMTQNLIHGRHDET